MERTITACGLRERPDSAGVPLNEGRRTEARAALSCQAATTCSAATNSFDIETNASLLGILDRLQPDFLYCYHRRIAAISLVVCRHW